MPDEVVTPEADEQELDNFFDEIRADVETAVSVFAALDEIDMAMKTKAVQKSIGKAKEDCIVIMCKGLEILREGYEKEDE